MFFDTHIFNTYMVCENRYVSIMQKGTNRPLFCHKESHELKKKYLLENGSTPFTVSLVRTVLVLMDIGLIDGVKNIIRSRRGQSSSGRVTCAGFLEMRAYDHWYSFLLDSEVYICFYCVNVFNFASKDHYLQTGQV